MGNEISLGDNRRMILELQSAIKDSNTIQRCVGLPITTITGMFVATGIPAIVVVGGVGAAVGVAINAYLMNGQKADLKQIVEIE